MCDETCLLCIRTYLQAVFCSCNPVMNSPMHVSVFILFAACTPKGGVSGVEVNAFAALCPRVLDTAHFLCVRILSAGKPTSSVKIYFSTALVVWWLPSTFTCADLNDISV